MKLTILFLIGIISPLFQNLEFLDDFDTGYKYAVDNQASFSNLNEQDFLTAIYTHFNVSSAIRIRPLAVVLNEGNNTWSAEVNQLLVELNSSISKAETFEEFLRALIILENQTSQLNRSDRDHFLEFIKILRDAMLLLYHDLQHYTHCCDVEYAIPQFWPSLGKCAAGIIGGAGTGALAGAAIGAGAAGIGAPVGAIVGALAGAYTAAANYCD